MKRKAKSVLKYMAWLPAVFMMITIWGFSSNQGEVSTSQSRGVIDVLLETVENISGSQWDAKTRQELGEMLQMPIRKMAHMTEYAVFTITVAAPLCLFVKRKKRIGWITIVGCLAYASMDELHQLFVPGRSGRITDVFIDGIGIGVGFLIFYILKWKITVNKFSISPFHN